MLQKLCFRSFLGGSATSNCDETEFWPNLWVLSWVFMGFMSFLRIICGKNEHLDWLPSSYIAIYVLVSKNWGSATSNCDKTQLWHNVMGFKVEFHGFYGFNAYIL